MTHDCFWPLVRRLVGDVRFLGPRWSADEYERIRSTARSLFPRLVLECARLEPTDGGAPARSPGGTRGAPTPQLDGDEEGGES